MPSPTALISKLDRLLTRFSPADRKIYKRITTLTGDALIGRETPSVVDTLMVPQPYAHRLGRERLPGGKAQAETIMDSNNQAIIADDWMAVASPDSISAVELANPGLQFVFVDSLGAQEVMRLVDVDSSGMQGMDVVYVMYLRSQVRP